MQKKFFFLAYFFICLDCLAQQYPFVHYTPKDGLVNSRVRKAYQDSKGRMYFLTFGGLSVYDGARFTNYTSGNGLASDMVNDVIEMGEDSMWIACNASTLNYLSQGVIRIFKPVDGFCPTINQFIKSKEGLVYVLADEGLFVFRQNRFVRLPIMNHRGFDAGKFLNLGFEWNDWLFVLSDPTLDRSARENFYAFNKREGKIIAECENRLVNIAGIGNDNEVYISFFNETPRVLDTFALRNNKIDVLPIRNSSKNFGAGVNYMYSDNKKNFWLFEPSGKIVRVDSAGTIKEFSMSNGLSSNSFTSVFMDKEGNTWITMNGSGVDKLVNDNIELFDPFQGTPVNGIYADNQTDSVYLYAASLKKIFISYNKEIFSYMSLEKEIIPNTLYASGKKLYISNSNDLFLFNPGKKPESTLLYKDTAEPSFGSIYKDPFHNVVLTGLSYLTVLIDDKIVFRYPANYLSDQLAFDSKKRLWAAPRNGRLYVLKINADDPANYLELLKNFSKECPEFSARSLTVDHLDNVWVGTRHHGIYCFQFDEKLAIRSLQHYTTKDGLSDNFISYLTCDNDNNIWASSLSGVDKISLVNNKIRIENLTRSNSIYKQILKTVVSKNGTAWCHTSDGNIIRISKAENPSSFHPSLFITGLKIGNATSDDLSSPASFSYRQNNFTISVAAPSFYDEQQIKYSYLLHGSGNDQWSEPSNNSTFNFINLNASAYKLQIKAMFPSGRYPDEIIDYAFVINPPWWQTLLFKLIVLIAAMLLLMIVVRFYYQRKLQKQRIILEKQQVIEQERARIAADMHDDLGAGLTKIKYIAEDILEKNDEGETIKPDLQKLKDFSEGLVESMGEIVWAVSEKNNRLSATLYYLRSYAVNYCEENNIDCVFDIPTDLTDRNVSGNMRRNIFLLLKECLHNVVKHAGASMVTINVAVKENLRMVIKDDGKGFSDKGNTNGNGLINMKKRVQDLKGLLTFENGNGTTVIINLPLTP